MKQVLHFKGLNGLRAIAALSVVFAHTTLALGSFGLDPCIFGKNADGNPTSTLLAGFGVSIFFALSGFLITYLLLEEKKINPINVKKFYIRRVLRIWPLYYLYIVLCISTFFVFSFSYPKDSILFYILIVPNFLFLFAKGAIPYLEHYWSLGVEEQFYSFWPWVLKKSTLVLRVIISFLLTLLVLKIGFRYIDIRYNHGAMGWQYQLLHGTRFQCMLIGAAGAVLYFQKNVLFIAVTNNFIAQLLGWIIIFLAAINKLHLVSLLDNEFISVVTVFLIIGQIVKTKRIVNLDTSFFDFVGKISYGIYVIHPLVIFYLTKVIRLTDKGSAINYLIVYLAVYLTTVFISYFSYEYFEKRFLRLKEKYSTVKSSGTMHFEELAEAKK